jgi:hypothetical protein
MWRAGDVVMAIQSTPGPVASASNAEELVNQEVCQVMQKQRQDRTFICFCRSGERKGWGSV